VLERALLPRSHLRVLAYGPIQQAIDKPRMGAGDLGAVGRRSSRNDAFLAKFVN